ncbi:MAG: aminotransferase class I/II-fold pyridoxal phosphate-dependent enzyme [bacterium]|nr:aminotransferase class I/II-fold pyridoxal phosphate-dependent enzyme [bacterium]
MRIIAKRSESKKLSSNILTIAAEAREAKKVNPNVIDGTIGTLYDEDGKMLEFPSIKKIIDSLSYAEKFGYASTAGTAKFKEGIARWALMQTYEDVTKDFYYGVIPTPGGSGAIGNTIDNYADEGDSILVPNICWGPYNAMAKERGCSVKNYELFKDGKFNTEDFKKDALELAEKQGRVLAIINDPCQNPTGYALEDSDWDEIIDCINEISKDKTFVLLYDMAYIDYSHKGLSESREIFRKFKQFNENVMVVLAFSGSKTFSLYGLRIGAQMALTKDKEEIEYFNNANEFSARATWSNAAKMGVSLVEKLMFNDALRNEFKKELEGASNLLLDRSKLFLKEAKECNLECYTYKSGFFITIPCNGEKVFDRLKENNIFVVPLKQGIRISLSALSKKEIANLASKIKEVL